MTSWITDNLIKGVDGLAFGVLLFVIVVAAGPSHSWPSWAQPCSLRRFGTGRKGEYDLRRV